MKLAAIMMKRVLMFWGMLALITVGSRILFSEADTKTKPRKEITAENAQKTEVKKADLKDGDVKKDEVKHEKEMIPVSAIAKKGNQDVEKVIQTLNDTLDENRKLRTDITKLDSEFEKEKSKTNILTEQIKQLQGDVQDAKDAAKAKDEALEKERALIEKNRAALEDEKNKFEDVKTEAKKESQKVEDENEKLRGVLNHSILDSERDQFVMLLKKAENDSKRVAGELARTKTQTEKIRRELASQYYDLGNLLVEKQDYKNALIKYKKALKLNPNDSWTHHNLAVLYDFYFDDRKRAIYHYKKYLNLKPVQEEAGKIRERVMEMELGKMVTPGLPIKLDFDKYQKDLKDVK